MLEPFIITICMFGNPSACDQATQVWYQQWEYRSTIEMTEKELEKKYPWAQYVATPVILLRDKKYSTTIWNYKFFIGTDNVQVVRTWSF